MVKCLICDVEKSWSIVEHLKHVHKLTTRAYRKQFPEAEVKSPEARIAITNQQIRQWADDEFREKMTKSRKRTHGSEKFRREQSERLKAYYKRGGKTWNEGSTKEDDERIAAAGQKISQALLGTHHLPYSNVCWPSRENWTQERITDWKRKISETLARKHSLGEIQQESNRYKVGNYTSILGVVEHYQSGWEHELMMTLDELCTQNVISSWTKCHGIVLDYELNGSRKYIPDFLVKINDIELVIELKGFIRDALEVLIKNHVAWNAFGERFVFCTSVNEAKEFICDFQKLKQ